MQISGRLTIKSYLDMEIPIRKLKRERKNALVFLGKVGLGISREHLLCRELDSYDKGPKHHWRFSDNSVLYFDYLGRDDDVYKWQGSQITFIEFDELTHFSEKQFFYMLSRNRSTCGVKPYIRATCNLDADSWVAKFIEWWIDQDMGYPIPERSGVIRYMARINDEIIWGNSIQKLSEQGISAPLPFRR